MAIGKRRKGHQGAIWVETRDLPRPSGHPFYVGLNNVLDEAGFDDHVDALCQRFYAGDVGRPGLAPAVYFRTLLIGYFENIDSERGIAWRCADSLALREFLGLSITEATPDHSTISRTRRLIDLETHEAVFQWVLVRLAKAGLLKGKTIGVDATTLEANAALRSIVRRDSGEAYRDFLVGLAKASGIETPTLEDLARLDRKRAKKGSNDDWVNPHDPDAQISKMKDGSTHLAHKAEHAVDLDTGAVIGVTLHGGSEGDSSTLPETLVTVEKNVTKVQEDEEAAEKLDLNVCREVVMDKGYHSNETLVDLDANRYRTYVSEPDRGRRVWIGKEDAKAAVYANRRRIQGERGKRLLRRRGELLERPFSHYANDNGMRRVHLRHHANILKRLLVHVAGLNLGLLMRKLTGAGTPRGLRELLKIDALNLTAASICLSIVTCYEWVLSIPEHEALCPE